ncbi:MAG: hypothetical protein KC621_10690, partial [Myxococcales bacterium]|nr:hypothetical protein [Myxococcales bacterium]
DADSDADTDTGALHTGDTGVVDHDLDNDGYDDIAFGGDDCDDTDPYQNPGADERCNNLEDDDCDTYIDEDDAVDAQLWYADTDNDQHGDPTVSVRRCVQPANTAAVGDDCDDTEGTVFPGAPAVACDQLDNDCDPLTFEAGQVLLNGNPVASLATALNTATAGSVVVLCEGRYATSALEITVGLTLAGPGPDITVVDGSAGGAVLSVLTAAPVTIAGMTLTNGSGRPIATDTYGGGVFATDNARVVLSDLVIDGNVAGHGGGVALGDSALLDLRDSVVSGNHTDPALTFSGDSGGGVSTGSDAVITMPNSEVRENTSLRCGGFELGPRGSLTGDATSAITANAATGTGGGGVCGQTDTVLSTLDIGYNTSTNAAGGLFLTNGATVTDVVLQHNESDLPGGGAKVTGDVSFTNTSFLVNRGFDGAGLEISGGTTTLTGCTVDQNAVTFFAADGGGANVLSGGILVSVGSSWGSNNPNDVAVPSATWNVAPGPANFTCNGSTSVCQ